jgi:hypothetical protein
VPSRHTYLASAGLALLVGIAWVAARPRLRAPLAVALAALVVGFNIGYLWVKKRSQFAERAAPTEALVALAGRHSGEIHLRCFPYAQDVAVGAMRLAGHDPDRLILHPAAPANAADFCWNEPPKTKPSHDVAQALVLAAPATMPAPVQARSK